MTTTTTNTMKANTGMQFDAESMRAFVARATATLNPPPPKVILEPPPQEMQEAAAAAVNQVATNKPRVSAEMRGLLVQYCASQVQAIELADVPWAPLALRLGTRAEILKQAAEVANGENDSLWAEVLNERIRRVGADRAFRDVRWESLENRTLEMLVRLVEGNYVRDAGQLLAIANAARRINVVESGGSGGGQSQSVNISFGQVPEGNGLPPAGTVMKIDMTPRMAQTLANKGERSMTGRVIDGEMLSATELRSVLDEHLESKKPKPDESEGDSA